MFLIPYLHCLHRCCVHTKRDGNFCAIWLHTVNAKMRIDVNSRVTRAGERERVKLFEERAEKFAWCDVAKPISVEKETYQLAGHQTGRWSGSAGNGSHPDAAPEGDGEIPKGVGTFRRACGPTHTGFSGVSTTCTTQQRELLQPKVLLSSFPKRTGEWSRVVVTCVARVNTNDPAAKLTQVTQRENLLRVWCEHSILCTHALWEWGDLVNHRVPFSNNSHVSMCALKQSLLIIIKWIHHGVED